MPGREFVLITSLTPEQVVDVLRRRSEIAGAKAHPVAALFEGGSIASQGFELRLIGRRNHARVTVRGEIAASGAGSKVAVRVGVSDPFGVIWAGGCVVAALVALLSIRSWAQVPAGLGVAAGATALFMLHRFLSRRAFDDGASTAELALKDVLSASTAMPGEAQPGLRR